MKKVQRLIGVGDSKPASAPLSTSPNGSYLSSGISPIQYAASTTLDTSSTNLDASSNLLSPPSQAAQPQQPSQLAQGGLKQLSPQSSQTLLRSARASPQPQSPSMQQLQYFDLPSRSVSPIAPNSPRPLSPLVQPLATPGASSSTSTSKAFPSCEVHLVERPDLHKSLKALESVLVNLDEYRDLTARLAKVEKKLAKSASELERIKVVLETPALTLQVTSAMFEGLSEVSSRHAKHIQKEYEAVNDACAKYFKKVAKEERAHDELVQSLDAKIKKANAAHEKNVKKATGTKALESHDKYIATVQALTNEISRAKNAHALSMAAKSHASSLLVASTIGGLADVEFKHRCESVRRVGSHVGRLNELLCFASSEFMPALQASKFEEAEQGQADYLAGLAAQVEAQVAAQAQINAKINEDTQTILRAQEMGWRPPSPLAPPTTSYANLGRSNSINSNASRVTEAGGNTQQPIQQAPSNGNLATEQTSSVPSSTNLHPPENNTVRSRSNSSSKVEPISVAYASLSKPPATESDAVSAKSVTTDQTSRLGAPNEGDTQNSSAPKADLLGAGLGSVRLDGAAPGSTMNSKSVQPQTWENASTSSSSSAVAASGTSAGRTAGDSNSAPFTHDRDPTDSSRQEGSFADKLSVPREDSDAVPPSLSASNSAQGSEDGSRNPRTPDDSESLPPMQNVRNNHSKLQEQTPTTGILIHRNAHSVSNLADLKRTKAAASPSLRPAQRALEQYHELVPRTTTSLAATSFEQDPDPVNSTSGLSRSDSTHSVGSQQSGFFQSASPDQANARKISLWERERERMRQLEREDELSAIRMPVSANAGLSNPRPLSAVHSSSITSASYNNGNWSHSKMSERGLSDRIVDQQLGLGYPRPFSADAHDEDGYAPAVGSTRLSATGVSRSLSTDTTASERSFVARMKARYQAEKDLEREQRELKVLEKERAARRVTMDPHLSLPSLGGARGRVPEIASRYQMSGAATYAQEISSARRNYDSLPNNGRAGGGFSVKDPTTSVPSGHQGGGIDEFGGIVRDGRHASTLPSSGRGQEQTHSDVCGCHQCSGRHYGNGTTRVDASAGSAAGRGDPREFNVRRTSTPATPRNEPHMQQQYAEQQHAYASSPPRRDAQSQQTYAYRQQQQRLLAPALGTYEKLRRRSFEDPESGSDAGSRRVMFAQAPQSIR